MLFLLYPFLYRLFSLVLVSTSRNLIKAAFLFSTNEWMKIFLWYSPSHQIKLFLRLSHTKLNHSGSVYLPDPLVGRQIHSGFRELQSSCFNERMFYPWIGDEKLKRKTKTCYSYHLHLFPTLRTSNFSMTFMFTKVLRLSASNLSFFFPKKEIPDVPLQNLEY